MITPSDKMPKRTSTDKSATKELLSDDFYKEMSLRGYQYSGQFKSVTESSFDGYEGKLKWNENWISFIDCLLHFCVLEKDNRQLKLPTKIRKLTIDPVMQLQVVEQSENQEVDVSICRYSDIIRGGGIEIQGFNGQAVNRRKAHMDPILEKYGFVPYSASIAMTNINVARCCIQIVLENMPLGKIIAVEIDSGDEIEPFSELIVKTFSDSPLIKAEVHLLTAKATSPVGVIVNAKTLSDFENIYLLTVSTRLACDERFLKESKQNLNSNGALICRGLKGSFTKKSLPEEFDLIANFSTEQEDVFLLKFKNENFMKPEKIIEITAESGNWLEELKDAMEANSVLLYSQSEPISGIVGLLNCLKRETSVPLACVFIDDHQAPKFNLDNPFYSKQLKKGFAFNILREGQWGSFRHLEMCDDKKLKPRTSQCYVNNLVKGNLSSLSWLEGNMSDDFCNNDSDAVRIHFSALNFRDVMIASGKLFFPDVDRIKQQCLLGYELSGVTRDGRRVMGLGSTRLISTYCRASECVLLEVPDSWTLEEAATVPMVYLTALTAFLGLKTKIQKGKSVLVHAGSGGVGFAAMQIAFHYGLEVFTTVSTPEKKQFLLESFPLLKAENIGNSRDTSFEEMIIVNTKGQGVNFVLNSLSGDKLFASLRCLARFGTFLEIGKFDILNNTKIEFGFLEKNISIESIVLEDQNDILVSLEFSFLGFLIKISFCFRDTLDF